MSEIATAPLTHESARAALRTACRVAGLDCCGAELIRMGENAIYRLSAEPVAVRIGRSRDAALKEVRVACWLDSQDFPAARLAGGMPQPVAANGLSVTFWEFIQESDIPVSSDDLARTLRALHALPDPEGFRLPEFSPMPNGLERLAAVPPGSLDQDDLEFLLDRHHALAREFAGLNFVLPPGPVHSDAHNGNLMRDSEQVVRLIDFEVFAWGPREWDVAVLAVRYQAFGWVTAEEYESYASIYGFDPTQWSGFHVLRAIRELNMTTWLIQRLGESPEIDREIKLRIADLRDDHAPRHWSAF